MCDMFHKRYRNQRKICAQHFRRSEWIPNSIKYHEKFHWWKKNIKTRYVRYRVKNFTLMISNTHPCAITHKSMKNANTRNILRISCENGRSSMWATDHVPFSPFLSQPHPLRLVALEERSQSVASHPQLSPS